MSRISRQLCDEVQAPLRSRDNSRCRTTSKDDYKPKRSIVMEKQRVVNKLTPNDRSSSRIKFKSEETVLKKSFVETAVNTTLRGSVESDSHHMTLVRNRFEKCICKPPQKCIRRNAKEVQTFDPKLYSFSDKACLHSVETTNCGTQFFNVAPPEQNIAIRVVSQRESRSIDVPQNENLARLGILQRDSLKQARCQNVNHEITRQLDLMKLGLNLSNLGRKDSCQYEPKITSHQIPSINYMGARRWSLSQYPIRGPDF